MREHKNLQYAEYEQSAPEFIHQDQPLPEGDSHKEVVEGPGYDGETNPFVAPKRRRKIFGYALWKVFALLALASAIIVGATVGAVLGKRGSSGSSDSNTRPTMTPTTTPTTTATIPPVPETTNPSQAPSTNNENPTNLTVIDAVYGGKTLSEKARQSFQQGPNIVVDMENKEPWGTEDPWVNNKKCIAILHSYGPSLRTFVACEGDGKITLVPGDANRFAQEITRLGPSSPTMAVVSVVWGSAEIRDRDVYSDIVSYKKRNEDIPFTNDFFRKDTMYNSGKSGVIWYTENDFKTFKSLVAQENTLVGFG